MIDEPAWRVQETADYLCSRGYKDVTLQFSDNDLAYAAGVAVAVQAACAARGHPLQAYILADTTYNSLSVDEVAAAHVNAQCVVHYGRASLTRLSRLPAYFVFPEQQLDAAAAAACLAGSALLAGLNNGMHSSSADPSSNVSSADETGSGDRILQRVLVFLDQPLLHQLEAFQAALLSLVEAQQGPAAAQRLVFPSVPHQHMEPAARLHAAGRVAGCCGGGGDRSQPEQQQEAQQQAQQQAASPCCQGADACSGAASESAPATTADAAPAADPARETSAAEQVAAAAAAAADDTSAGAQDASAADGSSLHSLAGYQWRLPADIGTSDCGLAWVGAPDAPALLQLQLTHNACRWAMLDPAQMQAQPGSCLAAASTGPASSSNAPNNAATGSSGSSGSSSAPLQEGLPLEISRALRRRYFLVEKARDARIVGILVGTLGAAGYGDAVGALRLAAAAAGKKSYTLLVGKPSPAKLANFPEIEVFVLVADPQGQILDCKEYLAPIITPHEAMLAWGGVDGNGSTQWDERQYRLDFEGVVQEAAAAAGAQSGSGGSGTASQAQRRRRQEPRFSLLSGSYTGGGGSGSEDGSEEEAAPENGQQGGGSSSAGTALALHAQQALHLSVAPGGRSDLVEPRSAADYLLHKRTWQGVETPLVGAPAKAVEAAVQGRSGRAAGYVDEPPRQ